MRAWRGLMGLGAALAVVRCRPSDVLRVPAPAGVVSTARLQSQSGAEGVFGAARGQLFAAVAGGGFPAGGLLVWSGLLTDELSLTALSVGSSYANVDARTTAATGGFAEGGDAPWVALLQGRSSLLLAIPGLQQYEPPGGRQKVGEAYALVGYTELLLAETYCAGTTLDRVLPDGKGIQDGTPLTDDSLLGVAEADFDTAVAAANGDAAVAELARVGLGRTLLDRGQYAAAATAVQGVPTNFVYNVELEPDYSAGSTEGPNLYGDGIQNSMDVIFNVADQEGGNGLNFVSAHDARLLIDSTTYQAADGTPWRVPTRFEANLSDIPLATGIEARLIGAEAALQQHDVTTWLADLNALRNSGCTVSGPDTTCALGTGQVAGQTVGLPSLSDPGTDSGRVSLMFRERAFWLFGTGTRLGDLRRLIRQYGRDQTVVFPTGPYANGNDPNLPSPIPNYGADVNLTLPTPASGSADGHYTTVSNPKYAGCITSTKTA